MPAFADRCGMLEKSGGCGMVRKQVSSPLGQILLTSDGEAICGLWFEGQKHIPPWVPECPEGKALVFSETEAWLNAYFAGNCPATRPPLRPEGTLFQKRVWRILETIPCGSTVTYGEIAGRIAAETEKARMSARAVGNAVGRNPIAILIPCHRVIGADGRLLGYAGGVQRKRALLTLEGSLQYKA